VQGCGEQQRQDGEPMLEPSWGLVGLKRIVYCATTEEVEPSHDNLAYQQQMIEGLEIVLLWL